MVAYLPPFVFLFSWALALIGVEAPGTHGSTPFDELALRWMLFFGLGMSILGGAITHTVFAKDTAKSIGWEPSGFQYEVGFASLGMGLAGIYASVVDEPKAWVAASIAGGLFLLLAGLNHIVDRQGQELRAGEHRDRAQRPRRTDLTARAVDLDRSDLGRSWWTAGSTA
jgi:hypothetical protein